MMKDRKSGKIVRLQTVAFAYNEFGLQHNDHLDEIYLSALMNGIQIIMRPKVGEPAHRARSQVSMGCI